jgi:hypothetical protein
VLRVDLGDARALLQYVGRHRLYGDMILVGPTYRGAEPIVDASSFATRTSRDLPKNRGFQLGDGVALRLLRVRAEGLGAPTSPAARLALWRETSDELDVNSSSCCS